MNGDLLLKGGEAMERQGALYTLLEESMNVTAKLTAREVSAIRERFATGGVTKTDLAEAFGVSDTTIRRVVTRENWAS